MQATTTAAAVPDEAAAAIPAAGNTAMALSVLAAHLLCGLALPLLLLPASPLWLLALVPLTLLTVPHWALIHEAVHGHLHPRRAANEAAGRALGILFGASFAVLRFGHLSHHALNSSVTERPEFYDPAKLSRPRAILNFYCRLFFGIYFAEVASAVVCFLPRRRLVPLARSVFYEASEEARGMANRAERQLLEPRRLTEIRLDSLLALLWLGACLWLYGAHAWAWALAVVARGAIISFLDNAPHYGGEIDDADQGHDTRAPRPLAPFILNTNLHGTHHRHPNLPWTALPRAFAAGGAAAAYVGGYLTVPLRQLRGPLPYPGDRRRREPAPGA